MKEHLVFKTLSFDLCSVCSLCDVDLLFSFSLADLFVLTEIGSGCHKEANGAWRVVTLAASSLVDCCRRAFFDRLYLCIEWLKLSSVHYERVELSELVISRVFPRVSQALHVLTQLDFTVSYSLNTVL